MKSSPYVGLFMASIVSCSIVLGQSAPPTAKSETPSETKKGTAEEKAKSGQESPTPSKPVSESTTAQRQPRPEFGHEVMVDRRLAAFVRLRELLFETVKLDSEKRKKIDTMFDDYLTGLLDPNQKPHVQPRPEDAATPQELPELRKQLEAAEKTGDSEKISSIKAKIYCATIALEPSVVDEPSFFIDYVSKELNEEQRKEFGPVLYRWRMLRPPEVGPDNDFRQLRRSIRDPLVRESAELGEQLDTIVTEAIRTIELGPKRLDKAVMAELAANTKPKILEKLNPKQREQFEKTLDMLKRWHKEDPELAQKTRERLKDRQASRGSEKPSNHPTQGTPAKP